MGPIFGTGGRTGLQRSALTSVNGKHPQARPCNHRALLDRSPDAVSAERPIMSIWTASTARSAGPEQRPGLGSTWRAGRARAAAPASHHDSPFHSSGSHSGCPFITASATSGPRSIHWSHAVRRAMRPGVALPNSHVRTLTHARSLGMSASRAAVTLDGERFAA